MSGYWERTLTNRISRRRALAASASVAAAASFLAACGGGDDDGGSGGGGDSGGSGLVTKPVDTSKNAKQGGNWPNHVAADIQTLDPNNTTSGSALAPQGLSRLFLYRPSVFPELPIGQTDPDSAESAEISPDGLTVTVKIKPGLKFDPRPPTNSRVMDSEDVKYSWEAFSATNNSRGEMLNAISPTAPYLSMSVLDGRTVQFKLAYPVADTLWQLAFQRYMWLMPREAGGGFDPKLEMRGNGPWRLQKWEPSVGYTFTRNDSWHVDPKQPYLDGMQTTIISEYTQRRAQLLAGNLWTADIRAEDVMAAKSEQPKLSLYAQEFPVTRRNMIGFGYNPGSPFHDVRVRRAVSMLLERDAWVDAFYNVSGFAKDGLEVEPRWDSHYMAGDAPHWKDPKGTDLGEGAQYFKHNVAEAKKLMQAAGHNSALVTPGWFNLNVQGGETQVQSLLGMLNDSGLFNITLQGFPNAEWNLKFHTIQGKHDGIAFTQSSGQSGDIDAHISVRYNVGNGSRFLIPEVYPWYQKTQDLIVQQRRELDEKKRTTQLLDLQKELASQMPAVPWPGAANGYTLAWPYLANFSVWVPRSAQTPMIEVWPRYWYDESKKV